MPSTSSISSRNYLMAEKSPTNLTMDLKDDLALDIKDEFVDDDDDVAEILDGDHENENKVNGGNVVDEEPEDPIDLRVRNVVTMFHTCSHIDLRQITSRMCHAIYDRSKGVVEKMMRKPHACIKIWSSGKVILAGCRSEPEALAASRSVARLLQKILGPKIKFASYRVTNIMATCRLPFGIRIDNMAREHPREASYEPELNTGLIWKSIQPKSTVRIHTTGSIIVTGALSSADILEVLTNLYPILMQFRCQKPPQRDTVVNSTSDAKRMKYN